MKCEFCGKEFEPQGNRNLSRRRFCSKKCYTDFWYYRETKPKIKRTLKTVEPRKCITCGNEFTPDVNHINAKTCSRKCSSLYQRKKRSEERWKKTLEKLSIPKTCPVCEKEFVPHHWQQVFCSDECRTEDSKLRHKVYAEKLSAETVSMRHKKSRLNGNWLKAIERDNGTCQICGKQDSKNVHHLDGNGEKQYGKRCKNNTKLENLIVLCDQCHKDIHGIFLIKNGDGWVVKGNIFTKLGLKGTIKIVNRE